jgi:hypothetical protein
MASPVIASQSTFADTTNGTSRTIGKPTGTSSGDWLVLIVMMDGSSNITVSGSTFTELIQYNLSTVSGGVWLREADGSEGSTFTIGSASEAGTGICLRITGGDSTDIIDALSSFYGFPSTAGSGAIKAPMCYNASADSLVIYAAGCDNGSTTIAKPTGTTDVSINTSATTAAAQLTVSSADQASAGYTTDGLSFTSSSNAEEAISFTIVLRSTATQSFPAQAVVRCGSYAAPDGAVSNSLVFKTPYGTVDDDLLIACAVADSASRLVPDAGFTSIQDSSNSFVWAQAYYRVAATEPASYTWSTSTASLCGSMLRIVNADPADPINVSSVATGSDSAPTASTITPDENDCLLLFLSGNDDDDNTFDGGIPTGYTGLFSMGTAQGADSGIILAMDTQTTAAATGAVAGALTASEEWVAINIAINAGATTQAYTLTAASGSYVITGTAASLKAGRKLAAATAAYTISGTAASLKYGKTLSAGSGTYAITGTAAALLEARKLAAASGTYSISGTAAALKEARILVAGAGSYAITGAAAALLSGKKLAAASGSYLISGTAAALKEARILAAAAGSYVITGGAAALNFGKRLVAGSGSYSISGNDAGLIRTALLNSEAGIYILTGAAATLTSGLKLSGGIGSYSVAGSAATLTYDQTEPEPTPEPTQPPSLAGGGISGRKLRLNTTNYDSTRYEDRSPLAIYDRREAIRRKAEEARLANERIIDARMAEQERSKEAASRSAMLLAENEAFMMMMVH